MGEREDFNATTRKAIAAAAGHCCARCTKPTTCSGEDGKPYSLAEAAHNSAASKKGPRGDQSNKAPRDSQENGLWLCPSCHHLLDKNPTRYTYETLLKLKAQSEDRAKRLVHGDLVNQTSNQVQSLAEETLLRREESMRTQAGEPYIQITTCPLRRLLHLEETHWDKLCGEQLAIAPSYTGLQPGIPDELGVIYQGRQKNNMSRVFLTGEIIVITELEKELDRVSTLSTAHKCIRNIEEHYRRIEEPESPLLIKLTLGNLNSTRIANHPLPMGIGTTINEISGIKSTKTHITEKHNRAELVKDFYRRTGNGFDIPNDQLALLDT